METAEKRKHLPNRQPFNIWAFAGLWITIVVATGLWLALAFVFVNFAAFGIGELWDSFDEQQKYFREVVVWLILLTCAFSSIFLLFTLAQRWLIQHHWDTRLQAVQLMPIIFVILCILDALVYWQKSHNYISQVVFHWLDVTIISLPLWQTFVQWRWLRRYVQKAWLFLLMQGAGVALACYWWLERNVYFAHPLPTFISYLITLLVTGFVVYYLFTHHHITEKIKQKPKSN